jgi:hypothetical protein
VIANGAQAASAAFHSSDIVALHPPSLPVLNCPFLIFSVLDSANSDGRVVESLHSQHRPDSLLHSPIFLFHQIVQVLAGSNLDASRKFAVFFQLTRSGGWAARDSGESLSSGRCVLAS